MSSRARIYLTVINAVVYVLSFVRISSAAGDVAGVLAELPMAAAGWLLGLHAGVLLGPRSTPLTFPLHWLVPVSTWLAPTVLSSFASMALRGLAGSLRSLSIR